MISPIPHAAFTRRILTASVVCLAFSPAALASAPPSDGNEAYMESSMIVEAARADDAPSMRLRALTDAFSVLKSRGIEIVDAGRLIRADVFQVAQEEAVFNGAAGTRIMQVKEEGTMLVAWRFEDKDALTINARLRPDAITVGNELVMPVNATPAQWERIKNALGEESKKHDAQLTTGAEAAAALATLQTLRGQIELFHAQENRYPEFARFGWTQMVDAGYLASPPMNPISTCIDQTRIITLDESTAASVTIPSDQAAWVWHATTKTLHIAGHDESSLRERIVEQDRLLSELRNLQMDAAQEGADWMKERAVRGELAQMRTAIAEHYAAFAAMGSAEYPTLEDVQGVIANAHRAGTNPFNGSAAIQAARWNAAQPPVFGSAGWNYDAATGKFWANSEGSRENLL